MHSSNYRRLLSVITAGSLCIQGLLVHAQNTQTTKTVTVRTRDEFVIATQNAGPGTRILVEPGTYPGGFSLNDLQGTQGQPVVIAAADEQNPPVFEGGSGLHLRKPRFVELHNLVFSKSRGNGLNIDDGGDLNEPAHHVVLQGLQIRDVGPQGNRDGIKLSGVDDFIVKGCLIERWGDGGSAIDMVGCHQGTIENCEFKYRSDLAANGVQTKGGSSEITIRHCRFENAGSRSVNIGGSTGRAYFRPQGVDYEAKDITVEDNTFIGSMAPIAFVGVDGAKVRYNTIYRPTRWVIRILQENQDDEFVPCRNGWFSNNVIAFRADEISTIVNVGGKTAPETFRFAKNHWFCIDNPGRSTPRGLPVEETDGSYGENPRFVDEAKLDLGLKSTTPVRDAGVRTNQEE